MSKENTGWKEPQAMYSGVLKIGDMEFPCSVLSDQSRILTQSDFMDGMGDVLQRMGFETRSCRFTPFPIF